MTPLPRPDRETLLCWMSAFFDGELEEEEERALFEALEEDDELHQEFLALERTLSAVDLAGLTDAVMAAVSPAEVSPAGAGLLTSQLLDDEIGAEGEIRLQGLLEEGGPAADDALGLAATAEGVQSVLSALPASAFVTRQVADLPARVAAGLQREERAALLYSAALDGELSASEGEELSRLAPVVELEPAFAHLNELVGATLRLPLGDPAAARAGAAALQAIEAEGHRAAAIHDTPAPEPSFFTRLRGAFGTAFAPVAFAAAAAFAFVLLQSDGPKEGGAEGPPLQWAETFLSELEAAEPTEPAEPRELAVLSDNSATEVQALDSSSQVAAVFSTEASGITVIWVPEPTESGT